MPYRVELYAGLKRAIQKEWQLADFLVVDIAMRLHKDWLGTDPAQYLVPSDDLRGGMIYRFSVVDPTNRLAEHIFVFRVLYGQDEQTLWVIEGGYYRSAI